MINEVSVLLVLAGGLALPVLLPDRWACQHGRGLRRLVSGWVGIQIWAALAMLILYALGKLGTSAPLELADAVSFQYEGSVGLMFLLVSFIGWVTCRYSIRYLDGEIAQGKYFKWMSFTIAAVSGMVLSADLLTFGLCWCLTSFGLHHLLIHYADRPAAQRAAWTKFIVSRVGDAAVLTAICLYFPLLPSLHFADLAAAAADIDVTSQPAFQMATVALAIAVLAKSAQIPFHTWLPLTMETPTPVSALMHAGIVNAGGFLLVRCSPLMNASVAAQTLLVVVGTLTACLASVIMLTQTSIKKKLAYSTISQMGFMLMQCGLGAYSAAMLHILAHSLYKAHEFLSSGSVMSRRAAMQTTPVVKQVVQWPVLVVTMFALMGGAWGMLYLVGEDPFTKPAGWLLTGLLCAALTTWLVQTMAVARPQLVARGWLTATLLLALYSISFAIVDSIVPYHAAAGQPPLVLSMVALVAFAALLTFQFSLMSPWAVQKLRTWQIHAANGFYIESWLRGNSRYLKS